MKDPLKIFGFWWLPKEGEIKNPGTLHYSQKDGITLELYSKDEIPLEEEFQPEQIILGFSENGEEITLYKCKVFQAQSNIFGGLSKRQYLVELLFIGAHFVNYDQIKFKVLSGQITDLDFWLNSSNIRIDRNFLDQNKPNTMITYSAPESRVVDISSLVKIEIQHSTRITHQRMRCSIEETKEINIVCKGEAIHFLELNRFFKIFLELVQMAAQRKIYIPKLNGTLALENRKDILQKKEVAIYYQPIEELQEQRQLTPADFLFMYDDTSDKMIENWFNIYDNHENEISLYQTLFFKDRLFIETRYLNIVTALESLHSQKFDNAYIDKKEFKMRRNEIVESFPKYEEWLNNIFESANYKRLKSKINELLLNKSDLFSKLIEDISKFSDSVVDTRNEIVHHKKKKSSFEKEKLIYVIFILRFLFEAYMMEMIGFSETQVSKSVKKCEERYLSWGEAM